MSARKSSFFLVEHRLNSEAVPRSSFRANRNDGHAFALDHLKVGTQTTF